MTYHFVIRTLGLLAVCADFAVAQVDTGAISGVESFNLMNHPNFGLPNSTIGNAAVGTITTTINPERQNRFALKPYF